MKVTIFNGGPRKNGRTAAVTSSLKEITGPGTDEHFLYHMGIKGCITCGSKSGLEAAREMVREFVACDAAVLASPIYMWHMSDSLKSFIEVLMAVCKDDDEAAEKVKGKRLAAVFTTDVDENVAADAVDALGMLSGHLKMNYLGAFVLPFADLEKIAGTDCQNDIHEFARKIIG